MERRTVAPSPSGVSIASTFLMTCREVCTVLVAWSVMMDGGELAVFVGKK